MNKTRLLETLETRFIDNKPRHPDLDWSVVQEALDTDEALLAAVTWMEATGGEPDVLVLPIFDQPVYVDMSQESPKGRRSVCYDGEARLGRKKNPPEQSAIEWAEEQAVTLLSEEQYRAVQELEALDEKSSSWVLTPGEQRLLGGALFCDRRYARVFTYHNGADSYYAARGFRVYKPINR